LLAVEDEAVALGKEAADRGDDADPVLRGEGEDVAQ
jgi:hypothetical protein